MRGFGQIVETDGTGTLSTVVVTAIARHEGVDPTRLDPPLYEVIDPDALDALFAGRGEDPRSKTIRLAFSYDDCTVHVSSGGDVRIADSNDQRR